MSASLPASLLLLLFLLSLRTAGAGIFRSLVGSNCLKIENGVAPTYYHCLGCVTEEATGCLDDLRFNRTGTVRPSCDFAFMTQFYQKAECCPTIAVDKTGRLNLLQVGSSYPEALECLTNAGCKSHVIYAQLLEECTNVCQGATDPRPQFGGVSTCLAQYNAATQTVRPGLATLALALVTTLVAMHILTV